VLLLQAKGSDGSGYDGEDTGDADTEDGTDNASSGRRPSKTGAKRARLGGPCSSNPETPGMGKGPGAGNNSDPGAGAAGAYGMDLMQAYQAQYWDQAQNEVRLCLQCADTISLRHAVCLPGFEQHSVYSFVCRNVRDFTAWALRR
jgi:hypothetical protein